MVYKDTELSEELATIVAVDTSGLTISFGTIETLSEYEDEPLHYSATNYGDFYVKESLVLGAECFSDADCTQLMGVVTFLNLTRISIGEVETYTFDGNQTTHIYITANAPFTYTTATIINLGMIPKVVYQDNGKAFKSKYFQNCDFDEEGFNGVYANLGIHSVFAKPYNARAKVIERFFLEFQEEFEKMMPSYIGTSIEDKPAWLKRGEDLHRKMHQANTKGYIPTVQDAIKYINCWIEYHNSKPCPNDRSRSIQEVLNSVQKQNININVLNDLMMKTESRFITKHGITFLNMHYRSEAILGIRDSVHIRYSLFDLSKIHVYSTKGEFLCVAKRVQKVHPMANVLGTVKDMEEYKQQYKKQQQIKNRLIKTVKKTFAPEELEVLEIEHEPIQEIEKFEQPKPKRERKLTPREQQMNRPLFASNFEKYEWLMSNGCTNSEDRKWLTDYIRSDEYMNLYGD